MKSSQFVLVSILPLLGCSESGAEKVAARAAKLDASGEPSVVSPVGAKKRGSRQDGNWPQWRGPDRTDISEETGLLQDWPDGGP